MIILIIFRRLNNSYSVSKENQLYKNVDKNKMRLNESVEVKNKSKILVTFLSYISNAISLAKNKYERLLN